ncbi:MBOAT, membrane-bound O-acyltransferase family [Popillia japonica]|uniref:MBOAT, membrane-bound O-acyltransferase family n=1 Tax=Popillia japonica TaxID=7064 RepID=A0AAW1MJZ5_POPJA
MPLSQNNKKKMEANGKIASAQENSILTELLQIPHFQTIRYFFYALLLTYINRDVIIFFTDTQPAFGLKMFFRGFENIHVSLILWIFMFISHIMVFVIFNLWARARREVSFIESIKRPWDLIALSLLIMYYMGCFYYVPIFSQHLRLAPIISTIIQLENLRLVMKGHSFIRYNVPKVIASDSDPNKSVELPKPSHILYFSFAPTLLYKDKYLRTETPDHRLLLNCCVDFLCTIWLLGFVTDDFIPKSHQDAGLTKIDWIKLALSIHDSFLLGLFVFLALFYAIYQCWLNITGELLRFGNREFYQAWWTSTDYGEFFRTWNTVVQDWLYLYIYKEFKDNITPNNKVIPKLMVLFISALAIESSKSQAKVMAEQQEVSVLKVKKVENKEEHRKNCINCGYQHLHRKNCINCGYQHLYGKCPAFRKTCAKCQKQNHFAKMCKTRVEKRAKVNEVKEEAALVEDEDELYIDSLYRTTTSAVYSINMQKDTMWIQKVQINNKIIDFKLDTGAEINVLPLDVLNSITGLTELTPSDISIIAYGSKDFKIKSKGIVKLMCQVKDISNLIRRNRVDLKSSRNSPSIKAGIHSEPSDDSGNESKMNDVSNTLATNDNTINTDQAAGLANNMNPDITVTEKTYVTRSGRTVKQPRSLGDYHLA